MRRLFPQGSVPAVSSGRFGAPCCREGDHQATQKERILMDAMHSAIPMTAAWLQPG